MLEKIFLYVLILVGILSQGRARTFLDDDPRKSSSDLLVRNKRVVNRLSFEDKVTPITKAQYIVNILQVGENHCVGSILSHRTVITAALCVVLGESVYKVHSGSVFANKYGVLHNVTEKRVHGTLPHRTPDGIALLIVHPAFIYNPTTGFINLHTGPVLAGITGTVSGWGISLEKEGYRCGTRYPTKLRSVNVPILSHRECVNIFLNHFEITESEVCTFHLQKFCGDTDIGSPLVIEGQLAGIHIWRQQMTGRKSPDVFILLQHAAYREWIKTNTV